MRHRALLLLAGLASLAIILIAGTALAAPPNVVLGFATPVSGTITDADGEGTGFTGVLPNTAGNQYVPANINRTGSELRITTTAGDINANTQQNALFSTFDGTASYSVGASLVGPLGLSAGSQSAGIFVGPDQQNNVKLVAGRSSSGVYRIQLQREVNGTATAQNITVAGVQTATRIDLTIEVNSATDAVTGRYALNGGPANAIATTLPGIGTASDKAGVITTNAGTTQTITARYDHFVIEPGSSAMFQARRIIIEDGDAPNWHLPTVLEEGPDGRLWVAGMNGRIYVFNLDDDYNATVQRVETNIFNRPNFAFDGVTPAAPDVRGRMLTGMTFGPESTPTQQVLYVTHSDPQIYIKNIQPGESPIDPASGTITRLVFNADAQLIASQDLVTHLPRSSENHGLAGIAFGPDGWLYVSVGSNTNFGEQSLFFGYYPEVPLSASIIRINPMQMGAQTPTNPADDQTIDATVGSRFSWVDPCNVAAGETVGNGCSAAFTLAGSASNNGTVPGKFEIYATGFRNPYDLMWHSNGKLYANENEGNSGFGLASVGPGVNGRCTGTPYDPADAGDPPDELFQVQAGGYHGFPNPVRNECNWGGGVQPMTTYHIHSSTNGIAEYKAGNFGGLLQGQILSVNYAIGDSIDRVKLSPDGNTVLEKQTFGTGFEDPLDVIVDDAGTLIVAEHGGFPGKISVVEPVPGASPSCAPLGATDTDGDGFSDRDEIDNGTLRCNPASSPPDNDGDGISDMNDPDDDNDGTPDTSDPLQLDASNGANTTLPFSLLFNNSNVGGFFGTGFHGVQPSSNGGGPVVGLVGAGGAGGYMQVVAQAGTMQGSANSAVNAMQEGFDATDPFTASLFIGEPFQDGNPQGNEAGGVFFGPNEDNYIHLAVHANGGNPIIELGTEVNGTFTRNASSPALALPQSFVKVYLDGDPATDTVRARYQLGSNPIQTIGTVAVPASWFADPGLAGIYTTRQGSPNAQRTFIFDDFVIEPYTPGGGGDTTPPSLTARTPAVGATGVAVGSNVTATFNEALAPASVTTSSVTLTPTAGGGSIPAAVSLGSGNTVITLNPTSDLAAGTQYTATLSAVIEDPAGNNLPGAISWNFTTASAGGGSGAYLPSGGMVTVEAEGFSANTPRDGDSWTVGSTPAGSVGTSLTLGPDNGGGWDNNELGSAPQFDIPINFPTAGTWHVWVRAYNPNTAGNSLHIGLDGAGQANSVDVSNSTFGSWLWFRNRTSTPTARIEVPSPGVHTVNVFGREDGISIDRLVLTTNATYTPTGNGPAESPRDGGNPPGDTTPPSLTARTPAVGATGVAVGANVTATFDEALAPASVTTSSVTLTPTAGGAAIPSAVSLGSGNTVVTLNPNADLAAGTQYTATLTTAVEDVAGNNIPSAISWNFTTASAGGGSGAYLPSGGMVTVEAEGFSANTPRDGDSWTVGSTPAGSVGTSLTLGPDNGGGWDNNELGSAPQFDIPINFPTAGTWHVWVRAYNPNTAGNSLHIGLDGAGQANSVDVSNSTFGSWLWFRNRTSTPTARIEVPSPGVHTVNVFGREDGISIDRLVLTTNATYTPTGNGPAESPRDGGNPPGDTTPPSLTARTPAVGATGVAVGANVTATFNEALAPASVTTSSVTVAPTAGGAAVPAAVSLGSGNTVITLNPNADLAAGTQYTATITTAVEDVAGNNIPSAITWNFTTAAGGGGGGAFIPSGGQVVMEAENFTVNTPRGTDAWTSVGTPAGLVGTAMASGPDNGSGSGTPITTTSPEMTYQVNFPSAGTWHVWVRGYMPDGAGNSVHVGLDGATQAASADLTSNTFGAWTWFRTRTASPTARVEVPSAGVHTVNVWMREDGFVLDRLLLTTNATFTPTGNGPAESPRA